MRRLLLVAAVLAAGARGAGAQDGYGPYATLQQAGQVAPPPPSSLPPPPLPAPPGDWKIQDYGEQGRDGARLLADEPRPAAAPGSTDTGGDPSTLSRRFSLYNEFYRIQNSRSFNTTTANVILPIFAGGGTLGFNLPFTFTDLPGPGGNSAFGLSDVWARFVLFPTRWECFKERFDWPFERVTPIFGTEIYFPTAESALLLNPLAARLTVVSLGTQKYRLAPLAGFAWQVSERWSVIPVYLHYLSVAGNQNAASINQGKLRLFVQYEAPSGLYFKPEFQLLTDYNDHNRCDFYVAPEVGKVFKGGTTLYVKPGVGFVRTTNNRDWGLEGGIRTVF